MKKMLLSFCFISVILFSNNLNATEQLEKKLYQRQNLIIKHDSLNDHLIDTTLVELKELAQIQSSIIKIDNKILSAQNEIIFSYNELTMAHEELQAKHKNQKEELAKKEQWINWGIYGAAALLLLCLIFLILFIIKTVALSKFKKQLQDIIGINEAYKKQLDELSDNDTDIKQKELELTTTLEAHNNLKQKHDVLSSELSKLKAELIQVQSEKNTLKTDLLEKQTNTIDTTDFEHKINNLEQKVTAKDFEINRMNSVLTEKLAQISNLQSEIEKIKSTPNTSNEITNVESDYQNKEKELIDRFKEDKQKWHQELSKLQLEKEEQELLINELKNDIHNIKNNISENKNLTEDIDNTTYKEELEKSLSRIKELETILENTQKHHDINPTDTTALPANVIEMQEQINSLLTEVDAYKKLLDEELEARKEIMRFINEFKNLR